jgi:hypothetical protein
VFSGLVLWESSKIPFGTLADPGPGALPVLLAVVLLTCSLVVLLAGGAGERLDAIEWHEWRHGAAILGTLAFMAFATWVIAPRSSSGYFCWSASWKERAGSPV